MTAPICLDCHISIRPFAVCQSHRQKHLSAPTNGLNAMQLVLVSRNYHLDREALAAALEKGGMGYLGMIGSKKKVLTVFDELSKRGVSRKVLARVRAPIGINIGADSPAEIAVSVLAEVIMVLRAADGRPLCESLPTNRQREKIAS